MWSSATGGPCGPRMLAVVVLLMGLAGSQEGQASPDGVDARPPQDRTGLIWGIHAGLDTSYAFATDDVLVWTSPSFVERHPARTFLLAFPFGSELGWGVTQQVSITFESGLAPVLIGGDVVARAHLVTSYLLEHGLLVRVGVGISTVEAHITYDADQSAGPSRVVQVSGEETVEGIALSTVLGVGYEIPLSANWAAHFALDACLGFLDLGDEPETRLDDMLLEGAQARAGLRFFF